MVETTEEHMPSAERMRELLLGHKIVEARLTGDRPPDKWSSGPTGYLKLDDGTQLVLWGNDGGCACSAGCYPLTELNACDNIITNVEVEERPDSDDVPCPTCGKSWCLENDHEKPDVGYFRVFVFAEDRRIPIASFDGSDGNGYYGTGWWLTVGRSAADLGKGETGG